MRQWNALVFIHTKFFDTQLSNETVKHDILDNIYVGRCSDSERGEVKCSSHAGDITGILIFSGP